MATTDTTETTETTETEAVETPKKKAPAKPRAKKVVKEKEAEVKAPEAEILEAPVKGTYISALGRRKTSIARLRLLKNGKGLITINGKKLEEYFTVLEARNLVLSPLKAAGQETAVDVSAQVQGGGMNGQAESVRLALSRALIELNPTYRKTLKKMGFLTRDPRAKERKKFGLKRARRAPQWSKR